MLGLWVVLFAVFLIGSFFFAGIETGFISVNPLKITNLAIQGNRIAKWGRYLLLRKQRVISAVLIGNNICVVGATLCFQRLWTLASPTTPLAYIPMPDTILLLPMLVIIGEIVPKSLFRMYSFRLTLPAIPLLYFFYFLFLPFTFTLNLFLLRKKLDMASQRVFRRREMVLIAAEGSRQGTLTEDFDTIVHNSLFHAKRVIGEIATTVSSSYHQNVTVSTVAKKWHQLVDQPFIFVHSDTAQVSGYVHKNQLLSANPDESLGSLCKPIQLIDKALTISEFLQIEQSEPLYAIDQSRKKVVVKQSIYRLLFRRTFDQGQLAAV